MKELTCVDLFSGAGGLSIGFGLAGFNVLAANDFDTDCAKTYQYNHPHTQFIAGPIQDISGKELLSRTGLHVGELDCIIGGPPCQSFSVNNHQRGMQDERSGLFREYLRIVDSLKPKFVVMENVPGMSSVAKGRVIHDIVSGLKDLGYYIDAPVLLRAEDFGVPQERRRLLFIGSRLNSQIIKPRPVNGEANPPPTVWDAIGDLPELANGTGMEEQPYGMLPHTTYQKWSRGTCEILANHVAPALSKINLERLKHIPPGGSWRDIPFDLLPEGMKRARRSDHTKRYGRLRPEGLASTILTKCDPHWGAYFHPYQHRALSVREAARLQSFPDTFRFLGSKVEQYRQIGNAVPPLLAKSIAEVVREMIETANCGYSVAL